MPFDSRTRTILVFPRVCIIHRRLISLCPSPPGINSMIRVAFPTFAFSFINLPLDPLCVAFRSNHIATLFLYSVYIVPFSSKLDSKKVLPLSRRFINSPREDSRMFINGYLYTRIRYRNESISYIRLSS